MTSFRRLASTTCTRMNNTILSVSNLGESVLSPIDLDGLEMTLNWLLNFTAAGLPQISSIPYLFWNTNEQLGVHDWSIDAYQCLKSILAFPIWEFAPNNFGDPFKEPLPEDFYTTATICKPYDKIVVNPGMLTIYIVLQSALLLGAWAFIVWRHYEGSIIPNLSAFPLIDFVAKLIDKDSLDQNRSLLAERMEKLMWTCLRRSRTRLQLVIKGTGCTEVLNSGYDIA